MEITLDPPHGFGPVRLGMTADEAGTALAAMAGDGALLETGSLTRPSGLGVSIGFGVAAATQGRVNSIEVWRPDETDVVRFRGVDVFGHPALAVAGLLSREVDLRPFQDDSFFCPDLYLAFWRPFAADDDSEDEQGHYFQSVLVARPGYGDTPAEARARVAAGGLPGY